MHAKEILAVLSFVTTAVKQLYMESLHGVKAALEKDLLVFMLTFGPFATGSVIPLMKTEDNDLV